MNDEQLIPLRRLAKEIPSGRNEGHVHEKTLARWGRVGLQGVRLELTRVGGTVCSSRAALHRFFARLSVGSCNLMRATMTGDQPLTPRQERAELAADELLGPA
jgi:hypothetical protein